MRVTRWAAAVLCGLFAGGTGAWGQQASTIATIAGRIAGFHPSGEELHVAGNDDGLGLTEATFRAPLGLDVDADGNLIVADTLPAQPGNPFPGIIRIVSPLLGHPPVDAGAQGTLLYTVGPSSTLFPIDAPPSVPLPGTTGLVDVAVTRRATPATGSAGNWVVAARGNHQVRVYAPNGALVNVIGSGAIGFADGPASAAKFHDPAAVALDGAGNVWVADQTNHAIRRVDAVTGVVATIAGQATPRQDTGLACTPACPAGVLGGFADGPGDTVAQFRCPSGIAVDPAASEVFVGDLCNHRIRRIDLATGVVTTHAGGAAGYADGAAGAARFTLPAGVDRDAAGDVWVADAGNARVRRISRGKVTTIGKDETVTLDLFDLAGQGVAPPVVAPGVTHFSMPAGVVAGFVGALDVPGKDVVFVSDPGDSPTSGKRIRQITRVP